MSDDNSFPHTPEFKKRRPDGDLLERDVCERCGFVDYQNPKVVVGSAVLHGSKILMCKRAIEPRKGYWTLPAGYLELYETTEEGARREAMEEACAKIEIDRVLAVFSLAHISQIQVLYRAKLIDPNVAAGPESEEVALFEWDEIPWKEIAFPSVIWTLAALKTNWDRNDFPPAHNPPEGRFEFPPEGPPKV
jgi:ADP-ribose pyrophosphatase YjhB (NUDIX family)